MISKRHLLLFLWLSVVTSEPICNVAPTSGSLLVINQWDNNSGWKELAKSAIGFTGIKIEKLEGSTNGNHFNLLQSWNSAPVFSFAADKSTITPLPSNLNGSLQYFVDHAVGGAFRASIHLCTGPLGSPTPNPTAIMTPSPTPKLTPNPATPTQNLTPDPTPFTETPAPNDVSTFVCDDSPITGAQVDVHQWASSSGWFVLTESIEDFCAVHVVVESDPVTTNNHLHLAQDWSPPSLTDGNVDATTYIDVPPTLTGTAQFFIEHTIGAPYSAVVKLCRECTDNAPVASPTPKPPTTPPTLPTSPTSPTSECGSGPDNFVVPQPCLPQAMGIAVGNDFGDWRSKSSIEGFSNSGEDCRDLHDRYFVVAENGKAYHTWHPPSAQGCIFGHEHGDDSSSSEAFDYSGGYYPFGYVAELWEDRAEDHFGHKVTVANDLRMAIGEVQNGARVYDAGFKCHWHSKIHQGSYSADAFSNNLHEYFLTLECNDKHFEDNTRFSIKMLQEWGEPNEFALYENSAQELFDDVVNQGQSQLLFPWNNQPDNIPTNYASSPFDQDTSGGQREMDSFPGLQWKTWGPESDIAQPELWAGPSGASSVEIPGGGNIQTAPYYIMKNMARFARPTSSNSFQVKRTVDWCYDGSGNRLPGGFCSLLPVNYPGSDYYKSVESPFKGTVRALNFKQTELMNLNGPTEFCTNPFGKEPSSITPCGPNQVTQKASAVNNYWKSQGFGVNPHCIPDTTGFCHNMNIGGTLERWVFGHSDGQWNAERVGAVHVNGAEYIGAGIGYEWIMNHGNSEGVRIPN